MSIGISGSAHAWTYVAESSNYVDYARRKASFLDQRRYLGRLQLSVQNRMLNVFSYSQWGFLATLYDYSIADDKCRSDLACEK